MTNNNLTKDSFPRTRTSLRNYNYNNHLNNSPGSSPVNQSIVEGNTNDSQSHNNLDRNPKAAILAKCQQLRSGHKSG